MKNKSFAYIILLTIFIACQEEITQQIDLPIDSSTTKTADSLKNSETTIDSAQYMIDQKLNSWFDLAKMKKEIGFLQMGTSLPASFLPVKDSSSELYNYGAVGGLVMDRNISVKMGYQKLRELNRRFISISTYKPWYEKKDRYYETNNEQIIGIECMIDYETLGTYNFVGDLAEDILAELTAPTMEKNDCLVYFGSGKTLVLHIADEKVDWFKCYSLSDSCYSNQLLPENIYTWNLK